MNNYISDLIKQGEHQQLDFKFEVSDSKKIARTMVAFANKEGGRLLIGIKDNGKVTGIQSEEEYHMIEAAADMYCKPAVTFNAKIWKVEGKNVLEIYIPKSKNKPHYAPDASGRWTVYIRSKDENRLANSVLIKFWKRKTKSKGTFIQYSEKEKIVLDHINEYGNITLSKAKKITNLSKYKTEIILVNLLSVQILDIAFHENGILYVDKTRHPNYL